MSLRERVWRWQRVTIVILIIGGAHYLCYKGMVDASNWALVVSLATVSFFGTKAVEHWKQFTPGGGA